MELSTLANTPEFTLNATNIEAKVLKVHDGDSITMAFDTFNQGILAHKIRLLGIDTPELTSKDPEEKKHAINAKQHLAELILGKIVRADITGVDKYGRLLAVIRIGNITVNSHMVELGLANIYTGGKKKKWNFSQ